MNKNLTADEQKRLDELVDYFSFKTPEEELRFGLRFYHSTACVALEELHQAIGMLHTVSDRLSNFVPGIDPPDAPARILKETIDILIEAAGGLHDMREVIVTDSEIADIIGLYENNASTDRGSGDEQTTIKHVLSDEYKAILKKDAERRMAESNQDICTPEDITNWCWHHNAGHWPDGTPITDD